ncbi:hypothetical protein MP638_003733 [Amoeboaphelidium occidentale]|nr:hypothetical protein MP638_003733 [Amoeboaphelidium occidentale]
MQALKAATATATAASSAGSAPVRAKAIKKNPTVFQYFAHVGRNMYQMINRAKATEEARKEASNSKKLVLWNVAKDKRQLSYDIKLTVGLGASLASIGYLGGALPLIAVAPAIPAAWFMSNFHPAITPSYGRALNRSHPYYRQPKKSCSADVLLNTLSQTEVAKKSREFGTLQKALEKSALLSDDARYIYYFVLSLQKDISQQMKLKDLPPAALKDLRSLFNFSRVSVPYTKLGRALATRKVVQRILTNVDTWDKYLDDEDSSVDLTDVYEILVLRAGIAKECIDQLKMSRKGYKELNALCDLYLGFSKRIRDLPDEEKIPLYITAMTVLRSRSLQKIKKQ